MLLHYKNIKIKINPELISVTTLYVPIDGRGYMQQQPKRVNFPKSIIITQQITVNIHLVHKIMFLTVQQVRPHCLHHCSHSRPPIRQVDGGCYQTN